MMKNLAVLMLLFSFNCLADDSIPLEVEDMINSYANKPLISGKAREDLSENKPVKNYKQAKFDLELKVISCEKEEIPEFLKDKKIKHEACGDLEAKIIFDDKLETYLTKESVFTNVVPTKVIRTIPEIVRKGENYAIKDKQIVNTINLGTEISVTPTKIIDRSVQLDIAVKTTELANIDEIFLDSNNKSFVNSDIALKHRYLVASFPVEINQVETLGGSSAILTPITDNFKEESNYPESARLWLDVKLSLPDLK